MPMQYYRNFGLNWLDGSIRVDLDSAGRGVWADILALGSVSRRAGYLERSKGIPYTVQEMAQRFMISVALLEATIEVCMNEGRLSRLDDGTYFISNWNIYQDIKLGEEPNTHRFKGVPRPSIPQRQRRAIARKYANLFPDISLDVIARDFGYTIVDKKTGLVIGQEEVDEKTG